MSFSHFLVVVCYSAYRLCRYQISKMRHYHALLRAFARLLIVKKFDKKKKEKRKRKLEKSLQSSRFKSFFSLFLRALRLLWNIPIPKVAYGSLTAKNCHSQKSSPLPGSYWLLHVPTATTHPHSLPSQPHHIYTPHTNFAFMLLSLELLCLCLPFQMLFNRYAIFSICSALGWLFKSWAECVFVLSLLTFRRLYALKFVKQTQ